MRRLGWWAYPGAALFAAGAAALAADVPGWSSAWYVPAWWGYLLVLDALIHGLGGRSWIAGRRRALAVMAFWSAPFWFLFEAFNLRLQNWYYVLVPRDARLGELFAWLAFATVLPACCFHAELGCARGWFDDRRWRPLRLGPGAKTACAALGVASIVAPLAWPRYAFPLVWSATLWLPELANHRAGAPSLLGDLERGDPRRLLRLLAGGLMAGLVWEALNYWSRTKWIYTVPHLEGWKLFEMPIAGFLGFPPLALSAWACYVLVRRLGRAGRRRHLAMALVAVVGSHAVFLGMQRQTARSRRPVLAELSLLAPAEAAALDRAGAPTPELLLRRVDAGGLAALAAVSGVEPARLAEVHGTSRLALHKGMGIPAAERLWRLGIRRPADLARQDPGELWRLLQAQADGPGPVPRRAEVEVWVRAARVSGGLRR